MNWISGCSFGRWRPFGLVMFLACLVLGRAGLSYAATPVVMVNAGVQQAHEWSPSGQYFLQRIASDEVRVWQADGPRLLCILTVQAVPDAKIGFRSMVFSHDEFAVIALATLSGERGASRGRPTTGWLEWSLDDCPRATTAFEAAPDVPSSIWRLGSDQYVGVVGGGVGVSADHREVGSRPMKIEGFEVAEILAVSRSGGKVLVRDRRPEQVGVFDLEVGAHRSLTDLASNTGKRGDLGGYSAMSPSGKWVVTLDTLGRSAKVFDLSAMKLVTERALDGPPADAPELLAASMQAQIHMTYLDDDEHVLVHRVTHYPTEQRKRGAELMLWRLPDLREVAHWTLQHDAEIPVIDPKLFKEVGEAYLRGASITAGTLHFNEIVDLQPHRAREISGLSPVQAFKWAADGELLVHYAHRFMRWPLYSGGAEAAEMQFEGQPGPAGFSSDGRTLVTVSLLPQFPIRVVLRVFDVVSGYERARHELEGGQMFAGLSALAITSDGGLVAIARSVDAMHGGRYVVELIDAISGAVVDSRDGLGPVRKLQFSLDGRWLLLDHLILGLDGDKFGELAILPRRYLVQLAKGAAFGEDVLRADGDIDPEFEPPLPLGIPQRDVYDAFHSGWSTESQAGLALLDKPIVLQVESPSDSLSPDRKHVVSLGESGELVVRRVEDGLVLARLYMFFDGTWVVVGADGRFDSNNLIDGGHLHWVMPDRPMQAWPIEMFMREYFEPRLLPRLMAGESFPPVRNIAELNRAGPVIRSIDVRPAEDASGRVNVAVRVSETVDEDGRAGGLRDLYLMRDGKRVGRAVGLENGRSTVDANGHVVMFEGVRLSARSAQTQFAAYAFNSDGVKGPTSSVLHRHSATRNTEVQRTAYVVAIGVNAHDAEGWDLRFAVPDAELALNGLVLRLEALGEFDRVVGIPVLSDGSGARLASKRSVTELLRQFGDRSGDPGVLAAIPGSDAIREITPDDLLVVFFAGHGVSDDRAFYLIPSDIQTSPALWRGEVLPHADQAISSDELEFLFANIDAGEIALIIDACHSAAVIGEDHLKRGPLGLGGLGQLAYDKGMMILAASQSDAVALEADVLGHGLLSYALFRKGLDAQLADHWPKDGVIDLPEWLRFAPGEVSRLHRELRSGTVSLLDEQNRGAKRVDAPALAEAISRQGYVQEPVLFDFSRSAAPQRIKQTR